MITGVGVAAAIAIIGVVGFTVAGRKRARDSFSYSELSYNDENDGAGSLYGNNSFKRMRRSDRADSFGSLGSDILASLGNDVERGSFQSGMSIGSWQVPSERRSERDSGSFSHSSAVLTMDPADVLIAPADSHLIPDSSGSLQNRPGAVVVNQIDDFGDLDTLLGAIGDHIEPAQQNPLQKSGKSRRKKQASKKSRKRDKPKVRRGAQGMRGEKTASTAAAAVAAREATAGDGAADASSPSMSSLSSRASHAAAAAVDPRQQVEEIGIRLKQITVPPQLHHRTKPVQLLECIARACSHRDGRPLPADFDRLTPKARAGVYEQVIANCVLPPGHEELPKAKVERRLQLFRAAEAYFSQHAGPGSCWWDDGGNDSDSSSAS